MDHKRPRRALIASLVLLVGLPPAVAVARDMTAHKQHCEGDQGGAWWDTDAFGRERYKCLPSSEKMKAVCDSSRATAWFGGECMPARNVRRIRSSAKAKVERAARVINSELGSYTFDGKRYTIKADYDQKSCTLDIRWFPHEESEYVGATVYMDGAIAAIGGGREPALRARCAGSPVMRYYKQFDQFPGRRQSPGYRIMVWDQSKGCIAYHKTRGGLAVKTSTQPIPLPRELSGAQRNRVQSALSQYRKACQEYMGVARASSGGKA